MVPWLTGDEIVIVACERTLGKQGWGEKGKRAVVKKNPSLPYLLFSLRTFTIVNFFPF